MEREQAREQLRERERVEGTIFFSFLLTPFFLLIDLFLIFSLGGVRHQGFEFRFQFVCLVT